MILHVGTNNLKRDKPKQINMKIIQLANNIKKQQHSFVEIAISSIIHRADDTTLNTNTDQENKSLKKLCLNSDLDFISNDNIKSNYLNIGGLHLNLKGKVRLIHKIYNI